MEENSNDQERGKRPERRRTNPRERREQQADRQKPPVNSRPPRAERDKSIGRAGSRRPPGRGEGEGTPGVVNKEGRRSKLDEFEETGRSAVSSERRSRRPRPSRLDLQASRRRRSQSPNPRSRDGSEADASDGRRRRGQSPNPRSRDGSQAAAADERDKAGDKDSSGSASEDELKESDDEEVEGDGPTYQDFEGEAMYGEIPEAESLIYRTQVERPFKISILPSSHLEAAELHRAMFVPRPGETLPSLHLDLSRRLKKVLVWARRADGDKDEDGVIFSSEDEIIRPLLPSHDGLYMERFPKRSTTLMKQKRLAGRLQREIDYRQDSDSEGSEHGRTSKEEHFFDPDLGTSVNPKPTLCPDPVSKILLRPVNALNEDIDAEFNPELATGVAITANEDRTELEVDIQKLVFYDHPLFCHEDKLYAKIRLLYGEYRRQVESCEAPYLVRRLKAIVQRVRSINVELAFAKDRQGGGKINNQQNMLMDLQQLLNDFCESLVRFMEIRSEVRSLARGLYIHWNELKSYRETQRYVLTPALLSAKELTMKVSQFADKEPSILEEDGNESDESAFDATSMASSKRSLKGKPKQNAKKTKGGGLGPPVGEIEMAFDVREPVTQMDKMLESIQGHFIAAKKEEENGENDASEKPEEGSVSSESSRTRLNRARLQTYVLLTRCIQSAQNQFKHSDLRDYALKLTSTHPYLMDEQCGFDPSASVEEQQWKRTELNRRRRIRRQYFALSVKVNEKQVMRTQWKPLHWPSFTCDLAQKVCLQLSKRPSSLQVSVVQSSMFISEKAIASVMVPVPGQDIQHDGENTHGLGLNKNWYQFASESPMTDQQVDPEPLRGADKDFAPSLSGWSIAKRHTRGAVLVGVEWEAGVLDEAGAPTLLPPFRIEESKGRLLGQDSSSNQDTVPDFARDQHFLKLLPSLDELDPNDPRNAQILRFRDIMLPSETKHDYFRTWEPSQILIFNDPQGLPYNYAERFREPQRHTLLRLRREKPSLFTDPIPLSEDVIRKSEHYRELLQTHQTKTKLADIMPSQDEKNTAVDVAKLHDFARRIKESRAIQQAKGVHQRRPLLSSIVREKQFFGEGGFDLGEFLSQFNKGRKLRPLPSLRKAITTQVHRCRLLVQIVSARNIPIREAQDDEDGHRKRRGRRRQRKEDDRKKRSNRHLSIEGGEDEDDLLLAEEAPKEVNSFAEVRFQGEVERTEAQAGISPNWKCPVEIPFHPPRNDFSPNHLAQVRDVIHITIFDEIEIDDGDKGGYYADEDGIRIEKHYIGSIEIPFSTVFFEGKVEGLFRLNTPAFNIGYTKTRVGYDFPNDEQIQSETREGARKKRKEGTSGPGADFFLNEAETSPYLHLHITLDPLLVTPAEDPEKGLVLKEHRRLVAHATKWLAAYKTANKHTLKRKVQVFAPDMAGCLTLVTRYLCPQSPPKDMTDVREVAHFVSLIPFLDDVQAFDGDLDLWCTSQQFLDILAGDWEEHAVLLCNYINYLGQRSKRDTFRAFLVMGRGIPEGDTIYVMQQIGDSWDNVIFWNASTGCGYSSKDELCPLKDIACIVSKDNIYANMQKYGHPFQISYDIENNQRAWRPLFSSKFPKPSNLFPVQEPRLRYLKTSNSRKNEIEKLILHSIKKEMRRWRSKKSHTAFNQDASTRLRELCDSLEQAKSGKQPFSRQDHLQRLEPILKVKKMYGSPLHFGFTDVDTIVEQIRSVGVHENTHPQVQFALGIFIQEYPCDILSVWVYLAALTPKY